MEVISIYCIARPYEMHTVTTWTNCRVSSVSADGTSIYRWPRKT